MAWLGRVLGTQDATLLRYSNDERKIFAASFRIGWTVLAFGVAGVIAIAIWAAGVVHTSSGTQVASFWAFFGADLLVGAAAAAAGALFGFIFGIPRTVDAATATATAAAQSGPAAATHAAMAANTNLERISDWLTTLLIGATLVQIKDLAAWVGGLGEHLTAGGAAANQAVVPIIVIYFFALSFLGIYLITRLYLTSAFLNTLGMLSGVSGERAASFDLGQMKKTLADAAASDKTDDHKAAVVDLNRWQYSDTEREDPELNANLARILAKLIAADATAGLPGDPGEDFKAAVTKAAADPEQKMALKAELVPGKLATGKQELDSEVAKILG